MFVTSLAKWGFLSSTPGGVLYQDPAWPDYQVPDGVGDGDEPPGEPQPGAPGTPQPGAPGAPQARQPGQPGAPGREPGQPGQPGQPGPQGAQPGQPAGRNLPPYRVEQIQERQRLQQRLDTLEGENKRFRDALGQALGLAPQGPQLDARSQRLRDTILGLFPELKEYVEKVHPKSSQILGLADQAPQWGEQTTNYWRGVAARTLDQVHDGVAKLILGQDKAAKDLDPEALDDIRDGFIRWVERDKTGQRVMRYESQDPKLVGEYLQAFGQRYLDPVRRGAAVQVGQRGQRVAAAPQSGAAALPKPAEAPKPNLQDEDEVHGRAWAKMLELRGA